MRYRPDHKQQARERLVAAAGRRFREAGYGGSGVDGLAREAGVTSGAFYGHFDSKDDAFRAAVDAGLEELHGAIVAFQRDRGDAWLKAFVDFYLDAKRTCALGESCALQSLTPEVQRAGDDIRRAFEERSLAVAAAIACGLQGPRAQRLKQAWALLALLTGAVTMARASLSSDQAEQIAQSARTAALAIATPNSPTRNAAPRRGGRKSDST